METKKMGKATELTSRAVFWLHELERRGGGDLVPAPVWGDLKEAGLVTEPALPMRMTTGSSYVRLTERDPKEPILYIPVVSAKT
jgi:hypothetical protein